MAEECDGGGLAASRQPHLAKFVNFLQFDIYTNCGKSVADEARTIAELRRIAEGKPGEQRGVQPPTLNGHLTFLNQLLDYARGEGLRLDPDLSTSRLRARNTKDDRARNARPTLKKDAAARVFALPPFTGSRSWAEPFEPGEEVFHRALYYVPMLLFYGGGRREEFCGLAPNDIITDNDADPLHPSGPEQTSSPEESAIEAQRSVASRGGPSGIPGVRRRYQTTRIWRLFPDLYSPSSKSPMGDRFYREFKPALAAADTDEAGFVIHSLRRGFGDALKQRRITEEERGTRGRNRNVRALLRCVRNRDVVRNRLQGSRGNVGTHAASAATPAMGRKAGVCGFFSD